MKTKKYLYGLAIATVSLALGSCTEEVVSPSTNESNLELEVNTSSRSLVDGTHLPEGSIFSIACINLTKPDKCEFRNTLYSDGKAQIQGAPVKLRNDSIYQVRAWYPALEEPELLQEGGVYVDALSQIDYMYAQSQELSYNKSRANLVFNHIFSGLDLYIARNTISYQEMGLVSIEIGNLKLYGWYDFKKQDFTDTESGTVKLTPKDLNRIDYFYVGQYMVLPSESDETTISIHFENGKTLNHTFVRKPLIAGKLLRLHILISGDELKVTEQEIKPWEIADKVDIETSIAAAGKAVDLGLTNLWADRNMGAFDTVEYGQYYSYNQSVSELWGEGWQMPTSEDFEELISNCTWKWVKKGSLNGYEVSGNGNSIFLPAAGWFNEVDGFYNDLNYSGLYMCAQDGTALSFSSEGSKIETSVINAFLRSIRPVKVKK